MFCLQVLDLTPLLKKLRFYYKLECWLVSYKDEKKECDPIANYFMTHCLVLVS